MVGGGLFPDRERYRADGNGELGRTTYLYLPTCPNTYSHVIPDLRRDAASRLEDLLGERDR